MKNKIIQELLDNKIDENNPNILIEIKNDKYFYNELLSYGFTDEQILKFVYIFSAVKDDRDLCHNCQGLKFCPKQMRGITQNYFYNATYKNVEKSYIACNYKRSFDDIKKNIVYSDFPSEGVIEDIIEVAKQMGKTDEKSKLFSLIKKLIIHIDDVKNSHDLYKKGFFIKTSNNYSLANHLALYIAKLGMKTSFIDGREFFEDLKFADINAKNLALDNLSVARSSQAVIISHLGENYISDYGRDIMLLPLLQSLCVPGKINVILSPFSIVEFAALINKNYKNMASITVDILSRAFEQIELIELPILK